MARLKKSLLVLAALSAATYLAFNNQPSTTARAASAGGTISGRVVLVGDAPAPKKIKVTKDGEKCGTEVTADDLVVSADKGILNVVVSVVGLKGAPAKAATPPTIDLHALPGWNASGKESFRA